MQSLDEICFTSSLMNKIWTNPLRKISMQMKTECLNILHQYAKARHCLAEKVVAFVLLS